MTGFDSSIYLDTRESITINTDRDYDTLVREVFNSVTCGKKVSEIGGGRILADYSSWNRNRFIVCDICEIPSEYRSNPDGAHEYRIDMDGNLNDVKFIGERVVMAAGVAHPRFVRYGWQPFTRANLVNGAKLPASTFRVEIK